jgi:hypothetical protein
MVNHQTGLSTTPKKRQTREKRNTMSLRVWWTLLLGVVVLASIGYRALRGRERLLPLKRCSVHDVHFQTGDLLLYPPDGAVPLLLALSMDSSSYYHVGMVVVVEETPYVWEISARDKQAVLIPVDAAIRSRRVYYRAIKTPLSPERTLEYIYNHATDTYDIHVWYQAVSGVFPQPFFPTVPFRPLVASASGRVNCASMVAGLLQQEVGGFEDTPFPTPFDFSSLSTRPRLERWHPDRLFM